MKKFIIKKILESYAITENSEIYIECAKRLNDRRTTLQLLYSYIRYQLLNLY